LSRSGGGDVEALPVGRCAVRGGEIQVGDLDAGVLRLGVGGGGQDAAGRAASARVAMLAMRAVNLVKVIGLVPSVECGGGANADGEGILGDAVEVP